MEKQLSEALREEGQSLESMPKVSGRLTCQRCSNQKFIEQLPNGAYYCRVCLIFGRNQSDKALYTFPPLIFPRGNFLMWEGQLTCHQKKISDQLVSNTSSKKPTLIHAVTGAGKTEMIYASIASVVNQGGWVCIASPRVDVRLARDFSCEVCLMHAQSLAYKRCPIIIATTHQLMKFYKAFDLLIVDEVDAFPFIDNIHLNYAITQACKKDSVQVLLTATSTQDLNQKVKNKQLTMLTLARRFHGHHLVVPTFKQLFSLEKYLKQKNCLSD
ncbi:hypothetical protein STRIC_1701 [Streptococcus ictaluri 707-05]|uniref:Helicase ATP-binding domain-containing protein n=1 Tax=Streptococcus ictaluri 707-05 TaxID=764299 RepID=G5K4I0_9STRE|nr:hypothetical protein STRIC_1701 [Streptococcus ictaluri 707-05]